MEPNKYLKNAQHSLICIICLLCLTVWPETPSNNAEIKRIVHFAISAITHCTIYYKFLTNTNPVRRSTSKANALTVSTKNYLHQRQTAMCLCQHQYLTPFFSPLHYSMKTLIAVNFSNYVHRLNPATTGHHQSYSAAQLKTFFSKRKYFWHRTNLFWYIYKKHLLCQSNMGSDSKIKSDFLTIAQITGCSPQMSTDKMQWLHKIVWRGVSDAHQYLSLSNIGVWRRASDDL